MLTKAELPLKPKPLSVKKHVVPPPPPPPLPQSTPPSQESAPDAVQSAELEPDQLTDECPVQSDAPLDEIPGPSGETSRDEEADGSIEAGVVRRVKKGNLKRETGDALRKSRRVSFDPLALLLDASLEGELELVKKTALEVY